MPTEAKRETVAELREALSASRTLIVSEYRGLTVKEIAEIRRALRKQDVSYRIVKNRLLRIAAQDTIGDALSPMLTGPTAIAFGNDESSTAKAVIDATRPYRVVTITGGVLGDRAISADGVRSLASLPSRDVLLAQAIGAIVAPMAQTATLLQAPMAQTARLVAAFIDARGGDDGASAPVSA
jgi:large subunit ribosomal protein L10